MRRRSGLAILSAAAIAASHDGYGMCGPSPNGLRISIASMELASSPERNER